MKNIDQQVLEQNILKSGTEIFEAVEKSSLSIFDLQLYLGKLMDWAMREDQFKVNMFRFIDVLPSLNSAQAITDHAHQYFTPIADKLPSFLKLGINLSTNPLAAMAAAPLIKKQVKSVAEQFIVGESIHSALKGLKEIRKNGASFTVDLLGEASVSEAESEQYLEKCLELIQTLEKETPSWKESAPLVAGHPADQNSINISIKLSKLYSQIKPLNHELSVQVLSEKCARILSQAKKSNAFVYFDMEDTSTKSIFIDTFKNLLSLPEFKDYNRIGIVLQAYLKDSKKDLISLIDWAKQRKTTIGVRLVKGAYWDTETILAQQKDWPIPVWQKKSSSDANYEELTLILLQNLEFIYPAFASHNIRSLCHAVALAEILEIPKTKFELQFLYGMGVPIKNAFIKRGYLIREYAPVGELIPGMSYLVRRLLENTSNEGFLRQGFHDKENPQTLLKKPSFLPEDASVKNNAFTNEPLTDFTIKENRDHFVTEISKQKNKISETPLSSKPIIAGKKIENLSSIDTYSPEETNFHLGKVFLAEKITAIEAVESLNSFSPSWQNTPVSERASILRKTAEHFRDNKAELSALTTLECGKEILEADAEIAEAIDFLNYYADEAEKLFSTVRLGNSPGELNEYSYEPRGVNVVISPWNFPLAIPCGMFAASLVCGNPTVLKPAEQSSLVAEKMFSLFLKAGLPKNSAAFLPGLGEIVGPALITHPKTATIVFTGSRSVGLELVKQAGITSDGAVQVKKVIAEMGGKNSIIIDEDADIDETVKAVIYSAFGYQGQKCSACSKVIVVGDCYQNFITRLKEAVESIIVGPATDPATLVGPVIDKESYDRLQNEIENAKKSAKLLSQAPIRKELLEKGYYIQPSVFTDLPKNSPLLTKELFGPILAVVKVNTFEEAVTEALNTEYSLTGGVFSRSPRNIEYARKNFNVGNLYINRGCTGALVYRQPFGGSKMSGVGSKAGGPEYLKQFVTPRVVSENTIRRGFAPDLK
jgi:RHH-type transcriptional regulator, proline utilization regulon repressor / proline dehydrogenase / delta 1-pyrroline-5-carboxylate dehydrogenase